MQANNLWQEPQNDVAEPIRLVIALGFAPTTEERLRQLFLGQRPDNPNYRLVEATELSANILLVNFDNPVALRKKDILLSTVCPTAQVVAVSQGPLPNAPLHHIRGMLTASRLTAVLDKIQIATAPELPPIQAIVETAPADTQAAPPAEKLAHAEIDAAFLPTEQVRYRALVVDDSVAIQKSLELKLAGLAQIDGIDFADSGESALEMAALRQYDLIFLDIIMPGMDGYEACTQLRKRPEYKKTPIIMVSGKTSPLDEVKGVMAGCTTYITKPVQDEAFQKLSIRVLAWLSERKV
jgi:CheY-like chemotaxis protein